MTLNGDTATNFNLSMNISTIRSIIDLAGGYKVDFSDTTSPNNFRNVLGYDEGVLTGLYNQSQSILMMRTFNSIFINCDLCTGSYLNNKSTEALAAFSVNSVPVGWSISYQPFMPIFLSVPKTKTNFQDFHVWITDEKSNPINFNGEDVTITIVLRSV